MQSEVLFNEVKHLVGDIDDLRVSMKELRAELKEVRNELTQVNLFVSESKLGQRWLFATLSASAIVGGLVDTILRALKVY